MTSSRMVYNGIMSEPLHVSLLGKVVLRQGERPLSLSTHKTQALLIYLAVTQQPHSRAALAALLWSDMPEEAARANLRMTLTRLRKAVAAYLTVTRHTLAFNTAVSHVVDVTQFSRLLSTRGGAYN
ncbi:MAG: hypothetical protein R3E31_27540 [Chloroflexota bacterium]